MINECGGCQYHSFPYKAKIPVKIDGKYGERTFSNKEDVLNVIDIIKEETKNLNEKEGKDFDLALSLKSQLPFFCCPELLVDVTYQRDIKRYIYCEQFGVPPYEGGYGAQPPLWIDKAFIIKRAFAKLEKEQIKWHNNQLNNQ